MALSRFAVGAVALAALLALSAAAAPAPTPPKAGTETVIVVGPGQRPAAAATVDMRSDDRFGGNFVAVWPTKAYQMRSNGEVTLNCLVDVHGLAVSCSVVSEKPTGLGFASAALELRPTLKLKPAEGPDGPIAANMDIVFQFKAPDPVVGSNGSMLQDIPGKENFYLPPVGNAVVGNPLQMREVTMMNDPVWIQAATVEDVIHSYPPNAGNVEGYAVAHCHVEVTGELSGCQIIKETPEKLGFKDAALGLTGKFRIKPELARTPTKTPLWVDVPIRFPAPGEPHTVTAPVWLVQYDPASAASVFPGPAIAKGLTTGVGTARCVVTDDGSLADCAPADADPNGFSEAAVMLASVMKMNLWSADAAPVIGAEVLIPIQLSRN